MISKAQINAVLKDLGLGYIKASNGQSGQFKRDIVLEPRQKGLKGGGKGPLSVTDAHHDYSASVQKDVHDAFQALGAEVQKLTCYAGATHKLYNLCIVVQLDEKKVRVINFFWKAFGTYTPNAPRDPSYCTYWFVCEAEDRKIADRPAFSPDY